MGKKVVSTNKMFKKLQTDTDKFFKSKFTKYVVDYKVEDENIRVISNVGKTRLVKNTRSNISKINQAIIKNKIAIANKIDDYENTFMERLLVLLFNICLLGVAGVFIPFSFFTGKYLFFLLSVIVFSLCVLATSVIGTDYYVLAKEIQNLKKITGYKKENEFKLPEFNIDKIKSH